MLKGKQMAVIVQIRGKIVFYPQRLRRHEGSGAGAGAGGGRGQRDNLPLLQSISSRRHAHNLAEITPSRYENGHKRNVIKVTVWTAEGEALKAAPIYPSQIFGVVKLLGSIEVGKMADLIVTDGDPLEFKTNVKRMFINGKPVDLSSRHTR